MAKKGEKDWAAIAAERMHRPADRVRMPRFLVYSRNKKGKTTLAKSASPRTLIVDPESGTDEMKKSNPHVWPVYKWADMDEVYNFLRHVNVCPFKGCPQGEGHKFDWVSPDGLTKMNNMALKYVMKIQEERSLERIPGLVQQRDYGKSGELMKEMLNNFHNLPHGIVFTAQERQMEAFDSEEDEDYEESAAWYVPDLPKAVKAASNAIVDVIGRLYVVKLDTDPPRKQRRLWLGESSMYDTGYRSDFVLPDYLPNPTIPKLVTLMRTGEIPKPAKKKKD
jgi:hypothetical protein